MPQTKIIGYKKMFGFVLPDWVSESMVRRIGVGILSTAVMLLVLIFVVWPAFDSLKKAQSSLDKENSSLESLRQSKSGLEKVRSEISISDQERILAAMPRQYSPDGAIFMLRRISADTGVSIVSYTLPSGVLIEGGGGSVSNVGSEEMVEFSAFPIRITVAAPVDNLLSFVSRIESSLPYGVVSDLNLQEVTKLSRTQTSKNVQLVLEVKFYQSILHKLNINKIKSLTSEDLDLVRELATYNFLTVPDSTAQTAVSTSSGGIFGF